MTDRVMECIVTVAQTQSIAKAAQMLYITPSALSRMIQNQERKLGVRLFDRAGKRFRATQAGEAYVRWGLKILEMEGAMEEELRQISRGGHGMVRLGFPMILSAVVIEQIIPRFRREFPRVEMILSEDAGAELERKIENGQLDLAILPAERFVETMRYRPLLEENIVLALPADHPLLPEAEQREGLPYPYMDIRLFEDNTFIMLYPEQTLRKYTDQVFKSCGMTPYVPIQVHTIETSLRCVLSGLGVAVTYDRPVLNPRYQGKIRPVCFQETPRRIPLCLASHKDHTFTDAMESLAQVCGEVLQEK